MAWENLMRKSFKGFIRNLLEVIVIAVENLYLYPFISILNFLNIEEYSPKKF
jgi:hypothetical protein